MIYHKIVVNGGEVITSSTIKDFRLTESVNDSEDLTYGSVCSAEMRTTVVADGLSIKYGDTLILTEGDKPMGTFYVESAEKVSEHYIEITAYDGVSKLDKDVTEWLNQMTWPIPLYQFVKNVISYCGLKLKNVYLPFGERLVHKFDASGVTGRDICRWVGQLVGMYCHAEHDGEIAFDVYHGCPVAIADKDYRSDISLSHDTESISLSGDSLNERYLSGCLTFNTSFLSDSHTKDTLTLNARKTVKKNLYYQDSYEPSEFEVAPIEKVQIGFSDNDVGVVYPNDASKKNTYRISGNYLLGDESAYYLALKLHDSLASMRYSPARIVIPADNRIKAGQLINVYRKGKVTSLLIMSREESGSRLTLTCTGSENRESSTAVNSQSFKSLRGKYFNLLTDVNGLFAEVGDLEKDTLSKFNILSDTISAEVTARNEAVAELSGRLDVQAGLISAEVTARENSVAELSGRLDVQAGLISAKVSQTGGDSSTFSWKMEPTGMSWYANSQLIFSLSQNGGEFTGKIIAKTGEIGGFTIEDGYLQTNGATFANCPAGGIYIGPDGMNFSNAYRVDSLGELYATTGRFEGTVYAGNIAYGDGNVGYLPGGAIESGSITGGQYGQIGSETIGGWNVGMHEIAGGQWGNIGLSTVYDGNVTFKSTLGQVKTNADGISSLGSSVSVINSKLNGKTQATAIDVKGNLKGNHVYATSSLHYKNKEVKTVTINGHECLAIS